MITIQEITGKEGVSGSRFAIVSNFLILENAYNDLEKAFNINTVTSSLDVSTGQTGQIKAKVMFSNTLTLPASSTAKIILSGTGASAGNGEFSGKLTSASLAVGGTGTINTLSVVGTSTHGATATFSGIVSNNALQIGATGTFINTNVKSSVGNVELPSPSAGGGGLTGSFSSPYQLSGYENIVYADFGYVSGISADASNKTGFFFKLAPGAGATAAALPRGFTLTLVNTNSAEGYLACGVTGPSGS